MEITIRDNGVASLNRSTGGYRIARPPPCPDAHPPAERQDRTFRVSRCRFRLSIPVRWELIIMGKATVLVVEDELIVAENLKVTLTGRDMMFRNRVQQR